MNRDKVLFEKHGMTFLEDQHGKISCRMDENESVVVLAKKGDSFILIKQYRRPVDKKIIQLPGGGLNPGEGLEDAARRELLEETGYQCGKVDYLGKFLCSPWRSNEILHVFFTEELIGKPGQRLEDHETIEVVEMDIAECIGQIRENKLNDPELCFAVFQVLLRGLI